MSNTKTSLDTSPEILPGEPHKAERFKDELNFAEFPLASLADHVPEDQKTLVFVDTIFDEARKQPVTRKLTISASDEYGLPRALDEEVILGLIQLTNRQCFKERKVHFSSYELIKLLGWNEGAKSYKRIEEALKRWLGVTLYYDKAWWSKDEKCWVNENFHVLDSVTIFDRERREAKKASSDDPNAGRSHFVWNEIVFRSFQAGNLKEIDLDIYRQLNSSISKRIYRFLDKRFYQRSTLEFDLSTFAFEHIGISRSSTLSEVKRLLSKPILELEGIGFIRPLSKEERFKKQMKGVWKVNFQKGAQEAKLLMSEDEARLLELLKERGVTPAKASKLVRAHSTEKVLEKVAIHDWMLSRGDKRCKENPAGFLVAAIQGDFPVPSGFLKSKEESKSELKVVKTVQPSAAVFSKVLPTKEGAALQAKLNLETQKSDAFKVWWETLSEKEKVNFEAKAFRETDNFTKKYYLEGKGTTGTLYLATREKMLRECFENQGK